MSKSTASPKGAVGFEDYFSDVYGKRWEGLKAALSGDVKHIALGEGLLQPYYLDEASVIAALMLGVEPGDKVLDMCAAPGGKSLVLFHELAGEGSLISNEFSGARRSKLIRVIGDHIPESGLERITVKPFDAKKWCLYEQEAYDKILVDAPCSSERHVMNSPKHLDTWSRSRIKRLATRQYTMLVSALDVVKVGGAVLYCTCALSPEENDGIIEKLFKKRPDRFKLTLGKNYPGEQTMHGRLILPDAFPGMGPIFYSRFERIS